MTTTKTSTAEQTTQATVAPVELLNLDPATLTLETNVRTLTDAEQAKIDELADSIAAVGVYTPLRGVRDEAGQVMIRDGQRRLLAARQAEVATVPVVIHAEDNSGDARETARITQQVLANTGRALTAEDTAAAIDQLSLIGVPVQDIAARTGLDKDRVAATVASAGNDTVRAHTIDHELTLDQVTALIEFEDDPRAVEMLTRAAANGRFEHEVERLRRAKADEVARAAAAQPYIDQGITVMAHRPWYDPRTDDGKKLHQIDDLITAEGLPATIDDVDPENLWVYLAETETYTVRDTGETVAWNTVDWEWAPDQVDEDGEPWPLADGMHDPATIDTHTTWVVDYALTANPKADGLLARPAGMDTTAPDDDPEATAAALAAAQDQARHERRRLLTLNKAADAAEAVRREYVTTLLTRKTPPKGAAKLTATVAANGVRGRTVTGSVSLAAELLGIEHYAAGHAIAEKVSKASDNRAQVITLACTIAAFEDAYARSSWRDNPEDIKPYLDFLTTTGYVPADVETIITGERTADEAYEVITTVDQDAVETSDQDTDQAEE